MQKSRMTAFVDAEGIIDQELVPDKQIVNGKVHTEVIEIQASGFWYLLHDNAPAHSSGDVHKFLAKRSYRSCSLDLARAHFLLFPKLNNAMKETRFEAGRRCWKKRFLEHSTLRRSGRRIY
jgi:hypothetical protein